MHLANEVPPQSSAGGNHLSDYALTADLLAERTLDGLLAEHPGELVRTGEINFKNIYLYNIKILSPYMYRLFPTRYYVPLSLSLSLSLFLSLPLSLMT